jgi:hypothetical protein
LVLLFAAVATARLHRGEKATIAGDLVNLTLAAFVAWGRLLCHAPDDLKIRSPRLTRCGPMP